MLNTLRTFFITKVNPPLERILPEPYLVEGSWIQVSQSSPLLPFWSNLKERVGEDTVNRDQGFNRLEMLNLGKGVGSKAEKIENWKNLEHSSHTPYHIPTGLHIVNVDYS